MKYLKQFAGLSAAFLAGLCCMSAKRYDAEYMLAPALIAVSPDLKLNRHALLAGQAAGALLHLPSALPVLPLSAAVWALFWLVRPAKRSQKAFSPLLIGAMAGVWRAVRTVIDFSAMGLLLAVCEGVLCGCAVFFFRQFGTFADSGLDVWSTQDKTTASISLFLSLCIWDGAHLGAISGLHIWIFTVTVALALYAPPFTGAAAGAAVSAAGLIFAPDERAFLPLYLSGVLGLAAFARFGKRRALPAFWCCVAGAFVIGGMTRPALLLEAAAAAGLGFLLPPKKTPPAEPQTDGSLPEQYRALVRRIDQLQDAAGSRITFFPELAEKARLILANSGYTDINVTCAKDLLGGFFLDLSFENERGTVSPAALLGKMERVCGFALSQRRYYTDRDRVCACYVRRSPFTVRCAAVCKTKTGETVCGDNAVAFNADQSHYMLLLSDGMGSGKDAFAQSFWAVSLLQKLLRAGVAAEGAVSMVHSSLQLKNEDVSFTTVDLCTIDLNTGKAGFIKAGAVSTFILRQDEIIEVTGVSMPLGAADTADVATAQRTLCPEDIIVLISDGALARKDEMLCTLQAKRHEPCDKLARTLMDCVAAPAENRPDDDITVLVARFCKNGI